MLFDRRLDLYIKVCVAVVGEMASSALVPKFEDNEYETHAQERNNNEKDNIKSTQGGCWICWCWGWCSSCCWYFC